MHVTLTQVLYIWGILYAVANVIANAAAAGSLSWKVAHAFLALSPGDLGKLFAVFTADKP